MPRPTTDLVTLVASLAAVLALLAAEGGTRPVAGLRTAFELIDKKAGAARRMRCTPAGTWTGQPGHG